MKNFLDVAKKAAFQAGQLLLNNLDKSREVNYKGAGYYNPSSQMDKEAERVILDIITDAFPEHSFISEEKGEKSGFSDYSWLIDPLDGTVNFIHGNRYFGVSIALVYQGEINLGVVYNPVLDEMFAAVKGNGVYLNEKRIRVSAIDKLGKSLLAMGFPYERSSEAFSSSVRSFTHLARDSQAIRREGSTSLSLCNVACGRLDGFCVAGNEVWDYAAGILLVQEAGGRVTDFQGNPFRIFGSSNEVLATNGSIHGAILKCLEEEGKT